MTGKFLIFGTGDGADCFLGNADEEDLEFIIGFVDNNKEKQGKTHYGKRIYSIEEIKNLDYEQIIICSIAFKEIKEQLIQKGIEKYKITNSIWYFSFSNIKEFLLLKKEQKKLKNKNISIVSNYCWGLHIYRFLGLQYQSPFIGTFFTHEDFKKLLKNLKYYLGQPAIISTPENSLMKLALDDISIYFPHEKDHAILEKKWQRRLERFDFDNLFVQWDPTYKNPEGIENFLEDIDLPYKLSVYKDKSFITSNDKKIITSDPIDLIKWFNKEL